MKRTTAKELGQIKIEQYKLQKQCLGSGLIVKLPFMRKEGDFSIYPTTYSEKYLYFQDSNKCFKVDKETGRAVYTNKGSMPMDIYLTYCPTYTFTVDKQFIQAVLEEITSKNTAYQPDGTVVLFG